MDSLSQYITDILHWILHQVQHFAVWIFDQFLSVFDSVFNALPVSFLSAVPSVLSIGIDSLQLFGAIGGWSALGLIGSTYALRLSIMWFWR